MKPITGVIVGYGDRASAYCKYAETDPQVFQIKAVVDPDEAKRDAARKTFGLKEDMCFSDVSEILPLGKIADCVINGTMDQYHVQTALPLLSLGYDMLLEKPVCNNIADLMLIKETAEKNNCFLMVCHVLRYTPFFSSMKQLILDGAIGQIMHIESCENIGIAHASNSYIRGKWRREDVCGSSLLLAKCCHDLDLICWLNNVSVPTKVSSFGGRDFILPKNAPKGAGTRCLVDCRHVDTCRFSAKAIYVDNDYFPYYAWADMGKPWQDVTKEEKIESLKTTNYHGVCAFKTDGDIVDHQTVNLHFKNGSTAMHSMVLGAAKGGRKMHIVGTEGELMGNIEESVFVLRQFDSATAQYKETSYDVSKLIAEGDKHAGGDISIIKDFIATLQGRTPSISCTNINDSVYGHACVFKADESRLNGKELNVL